MSETPTLRVQQVLAPSGEPYRQTFRIIETRSIWTTPVVVVIQDLMGREVERREVSDICLPLLTVAGQTLTLRVQPDPPWVVTPGYIDWDAEYVQQAPAVPKVSF